MAKRMKDADLVKIIDAEIQRSTTYNSKISAERASALKAYDGAFYGNERKGRSTFVSRECLETVSWATPQIIKVLTTDGIIEFDPETASGVQSAEEATQYAQYTFNKKNNGFQILHTMVQDGLIEKNGIVKVYLDMEPKYEREEYSGLTMLQLTQLLQDDDVEVIEHEENEVELPELDPAIEAQLPQIMAGLQSGQLAPDAVPPEVMAAIAAHQNLPEPTHEVTLKRRVKKGGCVKVENIPNSEIVVSKDAKSLNLDESPFVAHRVKKTISWLRSQGYNVPDDVEDGDGGGSDMTADVIERQSEDGNFRGFNESATTSDPSLREVWYEEAYVRADYNGDGIAERRCVKKVGNKILENVEVICQPFVSTSPMPRSHRYNGQSLVDLVIDLQKTKSMMVRNVLDSMAFSLSPARAINIDAVVSVTDLLDTSPGSWIRMRGETQANIQQLPSGDNSQAALGLFSYFDNLVETRSGVSKVTQGISGDLFNKTATGTQAIMNASQEKIALIARIFAETGLAEIYKKIVKLASTYIKEEQEIRHEGAFKNVDPKAWANLETISVSVGADTGQEVGGIQQIMGLQEKLGAMPPQISSMVDPQKVYNAISKLAKTVGIKDIDSYFNSPQSPMYQQTMQAAMQKQPPPDPNLVLAQAQMSLSQTKEKELMAEVQKTQQEMFLKQQELDLKKAVEADKAETSHYKLQIDALTKLASTNPAAYAMLVGQIQTELNGVGNLNMQAPDALAGQIEMLARLAAQQQAQQPQGQEMMQEPMEQQPEQMEPMGQPEPQFQPPQM